MNVMGNCLATVVVARWEGVNFVKGVVVGSRGQLGAAVASGFNPSNGASGFSRTTYDVVALDRAALDITDADRVASTMAKLRRT